MYRKLFLTALKLIAILIVSHSCRASNPPYPSSPAHKTIQINNKEDLYIAINKLKPNTTLKLSPGRYILHRTLVIKQNNVNIEGKSNNPEDVILAGPGIYDKNNGKDMSCIWANSSNLSIKNLTIRDCYHHSIILNSGAQSPLFYNLKLINAGSQFIKSNGNKNGKGVNFGRVELTTFEYENGINHIDRGYGTGYFNGIDVHSGHSWTVTNNIFKNLYTNNITTHSWSPAVLFWNNSTNITIDNNVFINCNRAIAFGLNKKELLNAHAQITNNTILYNTGLFTKEKSSDSDAAIIIWGGKKVLIEGNKIITNNQVKFSIEFRFKTANGLIKNNLIDAPLNSRNGGIYIDKNNRKI